MVADAAKLMETDAPTYVDAVTNFDVTAEGGMTAHNYVITDDTFVCNVAIG
jgi:hypothetical protein